MTGSNVIGRLRWSGFAGAVLVAAGAYLAGAGPGAAPATRTAALWGTGAGFRLGLLAYLLGLALLGWAWWRIVRSRADDRDRRRVHDHRPPGVRWLLLTGALWTIPLLLAPPLGSRDVYAYACQGAGWLDGHDPYTVGAAAGDCRWLDAVPSLWHDAPAPYGPLGLLVSAAAVGLARLVATGEASQLLVAVGVLRAVAVLGVVLVAGFLPRLARACGVDPVDAAALGLVTPLVAIHLVSGAHHDALVAGLLVAGLALAVPPARPTEAVPAAEAAAPPAVPADPVPAVSPEAAVAGTPPTAAGRRLAAAGADRRMIRIIAAGALLGLAVAVKVTAIAALPFALLLAAASARPPVPRRGGPSTDGRPGSPPHGLGGAGSSQAPGYVGYSAIQDSHPANQVGSSPHQVSPLAEPAGAHHANPTSGGRGHPLVRGLRGYRSFKGWRGFSPVGGRRGHRVAPLAYAATLAVAPLGTFAALTVVTGLGIGWVHALTETGAIGQWSSLPTGLGMALGYALWGLGIPEAFDGTVAVARWLGIGVLVVLSVALLWRAWRSAGLASHRQPPPGTDRRDGTDGSDLPRDRRATRTVVAACGVVLAAVVVLGPVVYPWYAAGAFAVLAASVDTPSARRWLAVATLVVTALTLPSGLGVPVLTRLPGALLMAALVGWAAVWWWRRCRRARRPGRSPHAT